MPLAADVISYRLAESVGRAEVGPATEAIALLAEQVAAKAGAGDPAGFIEHVIVADQTRFGDTIHELQALAGHRQSFTNDDQMMAVGKTIPSPNDLSSSRVVILDRLVTGMMTHLASDPLSPTTNTETSVARAHQARAQYIIGHEFGHCCDAFLRRDRGLDTDIRAFEGSWIRPLCEYYARITLSEFVACAHSAFLLREDAHRLTLSEFGTDAEAFSQTVSVAYKEFKAESKSLYELAQATANIFWIIVVQAAKIIGCHVGNTDLPLVFLGVPHSVALELSGLVDVLSDEWTKYPHWDDASVRRIVNVWAAVALAYGYKFETAGGDALWLADELSMSQ